MIMLSLVHISTILHLIRVTSFVTAVLIVIGSLCRYSSNSLPLNMNDMTTIANNNTWIIQSILDRRLISTLVAAQASIFCPLFILLNPPSSTSATSTTSFICFVEFICQLLMPLGLGLSWMFSILFDSKTKDLVVSNGISSMCLEEQDDRLGCALFGLIHGLKYVIIVVFAMETFFVSSQFIISRYYMPQIQLPLDEEVLVAEEKNELCC